MKFDDAKSYCKKHEGKVYEPTSLVSDIATQWYIHNKKLWIEQGTYKYGAWIGLQRKGTHDK